MNWTIIAAVIITITAIILVKLSKKRANEIADYPYQNKCILFSPSERSFYGVLSQAVEDSAIIFGKVRVADVVEPIKGLSNSDRQKAFNKISPKHFDFILCRKNDLSIVCAIELDDSSHQAKNDE